MKYYVITDTHFGHEKLIEMGYRKPGFEEGILAHLSIIPMDAILIHLGDVCMGNDDWWHRKYLSTSMVGRNILVRGNHDSKSDSWYYDRGWDCVCRNLTIKMYGQKIMFSHIPQAYHGQYDINIHGHFHDSDHRKLDPELVAIKNDRQELVAIENTNLSAVTVESLVKRVVDRIEQKEGGGE